MDSIVLVLMRYTLFLCLFLAGCVTQPPERPDNKEIYYTYIRDAWGRCVLLPGVGKFNDLVVVNDAVCRSPEPPIEALPEK